MPNKFQELERWAKHMRFSFFSDTNFRKRFKLCKPAIDHVYQEYHRKVFATTHSYWDGEGPHLAASDSFDSRGYSALIGKVVMVDLNTKVMIHTEAFHRDETGVPFITS
ncbi:hypothetical protein ANCDUO_00908 [Ancylostoma duodenale]|uniref:Uncharacterized protein n=1 Tax=Ancylostoma duodenale TaxID=51022 RepID=A0A0C2DFI3_9BILA|nr:hypothetical protein ANCDUO_00908 [Ancylostoma duodenale]